MDDSSFMHGVSEVSNNTPVSYNPMQQEENVLSRRISRTMKAAEPIVYEFTKDKGYLHQYYILREQMYTQVWDLKGFVAQEDEFDRRSHILIARKGNQVIGGARLTIKNPRQNNLLPMEGEDFKISELFPWFNCDVLSVSECSRLAVLPEFRKDYVTSNILLRLTQKSIANGAPYSAGIAPVPQARSYRNIFREIGAEFKILSDIKTPEREEYEGIMMRVFFVDATAMQHAGSVYSSNNASLLSDELAV